MTDLYDNMPVVVGGDLGFHYTPEIVEMIQKALELRAKGVIKF